MDFETSEDVEVVGSFDTMGFKDELLRGIYAYGFEKPSAIQQRAIMPILKGRDTIAQAQSGTGKTTIYCAGALQCLDATQRETQVLALSPTRELAEQTQKVMLALGDYMSVQCHACIGGKSIGEDIRRLDAGVHAVSGTPGRVFDMIRRRNLRTRSIKMLVIDEADEMLSQGFKEQIYDIYRYLPPATQVVLISATLPGEILEMTRKFMTARHAARTSSHGVFPALLFLPLSLSVLLFLSSLPHPVYPSQDPVRILVKRDELTLEGIKQFFVAVPARPAAPPPPRSPPPLPARCSPGACARRRGSHRVRLAGARRSSARSGSSTRCATCTTRSRSRRPSSSATPRRRSTG